MVVHCADPLNCETAIPALIGGVIMPNARFYVRNHFRAPMIDASASARTRPVFSLGGAGGGLGAGGLLLGLPGGGLGVGCRLTDLVAVGLGGPGTLPGLGAGLGDGGVPLGSGGGHSLISLGAGLRYGGIPFLFGGGT